VGRRAVVEVAAAAAVVATLGIGCSRESEPPGPEAEIPAD
jgi:hypothetical protein